MGGMHFWLSALCVLSLHPAVQGADPVAKGLHLAPKLFPPQAGAGSATPGVHVESSEDGGNASDEADERAGVPQERQRRRLLQSGGAGFASILATGSNTFGQLGDGSDTTTLTPVAVMAAHTIAQVAAGGSNTGVDGHTLFVTTAGGAFSAGKNNYGQLGDGSNTNRWDPVPVLAGEIVSQVAAGLDFSLWVTTAGAAFSAGRNINGRLGDASTTDRWQPVPVMASHTVTQVAAGDYHSLWVTTTGAAYGAGRNNNGQLGDGTGTTLLSEPVQALIDDPIAQVSAGNAHSLWVTTAGVAYSAGQNNKGQLGVGSREEKDTPVAVVGITDPVAQVSARGAHSLWLTTSGAAFGAGFNGHGNLGSMSSGDQATPVAVAIDDPIAQVVAGNHHFSHFVTSAGSIYAAGYNGYGVFGDGTVVGKSRPPVLVYDTNTYPGTRVAAGARHAFFMLPPPPSLAPTGIPAITTSPTTSVPTGVAISVCCTKVWENPHFVCYVKRRYGIINRLDLKNKPEVCDYSC